MVKARTTANDQSSVEQLIAERHEIETWLNRLNGTTNSAPDHIRGRVKSDYAKRLQEIVESLRGHGQSVKQSLDTKREAKEALDERNRAARDKLAEAELRHSVGEFDTKEYKRLNANVKRELDESETEVVRLEEEIEQLESVFESIETTPDPAPKPKSRQTQSQKKIVEPEPPPTMPDSVEGFDELEFLKSVTGKQGEGDDGSAGKSGPRGRPSGIAPRESGTQRRPRLTSGPRSRPSSGGIPRPPRSSSVSPPDAVPIAKPSDSGDYISPRVVSRPGGEKTLRCAECATMNLPTEWYCENCGAELAAL